MDRNRIRKILNPKSNNFTRTNKKVIVLSCSLYILFKMEPVLLSHIYKLRMQDLISAKLVRK